MTRGTTLLEVALAAALMAITLALGLPAARRSVDRMAVLGAREGLVGAFARARSLAVEHGGASVTLEPSRSVVRLSVSTAVVDSLDLASSFGVEMVAGGSEGPVSLNFDGLGLGRVASRTVYVRRGGAEAGIVVSSYGRVTRR